MDVMPRQEIVEVHRLWISHALQVAEPPPTVVLGVVPPFAGSNVDNSRAWRT
jgi:hypothetical protein